jgi:RNA polymerase sigma-70 factor (sigma-E family)
MRPTDETGRPHVNAEAEREYHDFVAGSQRRLAQFATLITSDRHTAEDLVQAALVKAYLHWRTARNSPLPYVRRCMLNQRTDWWRRLRGREHVTCEIPDIASIADHADAHAKQATVRQALRELTQRERAVVVLRFFEDLTEAQVAAELGIALGTVKSTLFRALGKLRVAPELLLIRGTTAEMENAG